jgi:hypothetical protein
MMVDTRETEKELLEDHYLKVIDKINKYFEIDRGFILKDLLEEGQDNQYYTYLTKGIMSSLIYFKFLEIFSLYNGKSNFVYRVRKKVEVK